MASFVEQATLKIDDQSTKQIRAINRELNKLFKTAGKLKSMKFDFAGIKKAQNQVRGLNSTLNKLPRSRTVSVNINQKGTVPKIPRQQNPRSPAPQNQQNPRTPRGGFFGSSNNPVSIARAIITSYGAIKIGSAALTAVNASQAQDTRERSIFRNDPDTIKAIEDAARSAVLSTSRIDYTRGREIATDVSLGGVTNANLPQFTDLFTRTESAIGALFPGLEKSVTLFNNKMINLANASDDIVRSSELVKGGAQGIAAAGESFNAPTTTAALRTSGLAPTIDAHGLANFILLTDAMGQNIASGVTRLQKELFTPAEQAGAGSGLAKGAVKNLAERGLRGYQSDEQSLFNRDPAKFIEDVLGPRFRKAGVDTNNPDSIKKYIQTAGFNATSQRLILNTLTSQDERARQLKAVSGLDPNDPNAGTQGNLLLATNDLIASFNTLSSTVLTPLAETAAPLVSGIADYTEKVALTGSTFDRLKIAVEAAVAAFAVYKAGSSVLQAIFNPLNVSATALTGSAGALTRAAIALGGASVASGAAGTAGAVAAGAGVTATGAGVASKLFKVAGIAGVAITANDILGAIDPKGNLWGLTDGIDSYIKEKLGFNPSDLSNRDAPQKLGPPAPATMEPDRLSSLDSFLAGPTQFEQAFATGSQTASTNIETGLTTGLTTGANALTGGLAGAFAAGADLLAQRITGAINSAVINAPRVPVAAGDTGNMNPRE